MLQGCVFDIQRFATEDGPGIRTTVFMKGCGLRCRWCANPESWLFRPQVMLHGNACTGCGRCMASCPVQAIAHTEEFGFISAAHKCERCGKCVSACCFAARNMCGEAYSAGQLVEEVMRDAAYFKKSSGGVTFSGGEPLLQIDFLAEVSRRLKNEGISILIETCGHVPPKAIRRAAQDTDAIYYDVKHMDDARHRELTGAGNAQILSNLRWLADNFKGELTVRYPYIPGCNDGEADVRAFLQYAEGLGNVREVWVLPYHRLGLAKYKGLGLDYPLKEVPSLKRGDLSFLADMAKDYRLNIRV